MLNKKDLGASKNCNVKLLFSKPTKNVSLYQGKKSFLTGN